MSSHTKHGVCYGEVGTLSPIPVNQFPGRDKKKERTYVQETITVHEGLKKEMM
jgi:hypothetical protein